VSAPPGDFFFLYVLPSSLVFVCQTIFFLLFTFFTSGDGIEPPVDGLWVHEPEAWPFFSFFLLGSRDVGFLDAFFEFFTLFPVSVLFPGEA